MLTKHEPYKKRSAEKSKLRHYHRPCKLEDAHCVAYNADSRHRPIDERASTRRPRGRRTPDVRTTHEEESDETGNLYACGADTYRPGGWE